MGRILMAGVLMRRLMCLVQIVVVAACCSHIAFGQTSRAKNDQTRVRLTVELQRLLSAEVAAHPTLPGELLHIDDRKSGLDIDLSAGFFDRVSIRPLDPHHVFRVASVTKTFTAASILRLYEQRKIRLDGPISLYLPEEYLAVLNGGGYATNVITVRHLLTHTSGIHDYATDPKYYDAVLRHPKHRWTRMEQVQAAINWGKPHFAPGRGYHYSDTGYVLLGALIERLSGKPLAEAYRKLLNFRRLGLNETYLETLEPVPAETKDLSHPYFGEIDTVSFDPSFDLYGGGGLVSSVGDLARFYRALFDGKVFRHKATLRAMLTVPQTNERSPGGAYAMGISRRNIAGNICWGHTGFWGTLAYYCPKAKITIVRHYNQAAPSSDFKVNSLYEQIAGVLRIGK
jgi:D-alanyl-D-alanine carboxypeptidase